LKVNNIAFGQLTPSQENYRFAFRLWRKKKIGLIFGLERSVLILPKNPWKILFDADISAGNLRSVLADLTILNKIRTFFKENPQADF